MDKPKPLSTSRAFSYGLSMVLSGLAFGWMIGLSSSPIIQGVVTTLLAMAVGVVGILAGVKLEKRKGKVSGIVPLPSEETTSSAKELDVNPWPVTCLVL